MKDHTPKSNHHHIENVNEVTIKDSHLPQVAHQETTWYMIVFALWISGFGWIANFDAAFGGIVLIMEPYKQSFGTCHTTTDASEGTTKVCTVTALQQSLIQVTLLFMALGSALAGAAGHLIGRRHCLQIGCIFIAVGAGGMIGSDGNFLAYMACKCIGGVGIGILYSAAPTWGCEAVSPQKRGFLMSLYNLGLAAGNLVAAAICVGSSRFASNWSWRTPIACQIPAALILIAGSMLFPESPRWLLLKGDEQKARLSFSRFFNKDPYADEITWQINDVLEHIESERILSSTTSWTEMFLGLDLRRTLLAVLILLGNALTGIQFVIPYTALFLASIGIGNTYLINVIVNVCILAGTIPGPFLCEYVGRRLSLLGGYTLMALCMLIFAVVATCLGQSSHVAQQTLVAFLCIWAFTFGATSGPIAWVASAEMHSLRLRTYGQSFAVSIWEIFSFGAAFWTPYMLNVDYGNMGTNVGYFYFGITVVILLLTAAFVPELARLTLEQVDTYFVSNRPAWRTSLKRNKSLNS